MTGMDAVHQAANLFETAIFAGSFIVLAVVVIIALSYELQAKRRMP
jgi:hypothetical protein